MTPQTNSGSVLEKAVKSVFTTKGFVLEKYSNWAKNPSKFGEELLLTDAPYTTIYGHKGKTEFLLKSQKYNKNIRIECKWQQVAGSVDEKLPYLYLNCIESTPEKEITIIIDGDGWKDGAILWLKETVAKKKYLASELDGKVIHIFNLKEFLTWANKEF